MNRQNNVTLLYPCDSSKAFWSTNVDISSGYKCHILGILITLVQKKSAFPIIWHPLLLKIIHKRNKEPQQQEKKYIKVINL